ncbi:cystathionine beta-lyase [Pacificimonas sp. ICDLI1SI03]
MSDGAPEKFASDTQLIHAGRDARYTQGVVNPPVYHASTCTFETLAEFDERLKHPDDGLYYGRRGTPTIWALEDALTGMHADAAGTKLFPSGVAALAGAFLAVCRAGDHVLIADTAYEPTRVLANGVLKRMGVECEFYDPLIGSDISGLIRDDTRAIFMESPGSLTFEVQDVPAIVAAAKKRDVVTIIDNTWATPLLFPSLQHGVDIEVQSLTKFIVGHSDAMMGSVTANKALWPRVKATALRLGQCAGPDDVFLALRGVRTLSMRLRRHGETALKTAAAMQTHSAVADVLCPGIPGNPHHNLWQRDFLGYSSLFSVVLNGGERHHLAAMVDDLRLFSMGFSFGGFESLILPVSPGTVRSATPWSAPGPVLRIHCGLEDADDLIADLMAGLDRFQKAAA